ncbi:DUF1889 family protein [Escherichia fergusonii]|uniref:DUF1889 family protein n=3 Tax=Enterobacteriaceae TaxID=543 RepID=B7LPN9_ESCF3|nr:DUF1889 family protein [Escherichia fergusonii]CAQ88792.1 conserved hypothetical protein [Escherichia fergusonii ATCC 35469]EFL4493293.1 DUF1889 family protein [Escherichia fergusonii]EHG5995512.1 DUF1889 family protein [Escherichia fergusonii]EHG6001062.1 DUF1889 family protein [Escherichia fergusonii]
MIDVYNPFDLRGNLRSYRLIDYVVNFKDKNMPAVIDKALDFIGAMDISASTPSSMNESTAKGIFKCLKDLGVPASADDIIARGNEEGWNPEFTQKMVRWAKKMESGERVVIKNPEYFTSYMHDELKALV